MKILYDDSADQLSGSVGGQYFQTSVNTPSIRTKRNGGLRGRPFGNSQNGAFAYFSRVWRTLDDLQRGSFYDFGILCPEFSSLDPVSPTFAFNVFIALNSRARLVGYSPILSASDVYSSRAHVITDFRFAVNPFQVILRKDRISGGSTCAVYLQINFSVTDSVHLRNPLFVGHSNSSNTRGFTQFSSFDRIDIGSAVPSSVTASLFTVSPDGRFFTQGEIATTFDVF